MPSSILIVEGWDEYALVNGIAQSLDIKISHIDNKTKNQNEYKSAAIALVVTNREGGVLKERLELAIADTGFQKIGLIYDSEEDAAATKQKLDNLIAGLDEKLRKNKSIDVVQVPASNQVGSLETLCLGTLDKNDPLLACSDSFVSCVKPHTNALNTNARQDKLRFAAWHGAKTGETISAFKHGKELDFTHIAFTPIVNLLKQLAA